MLERSRLIVPPLSPVWELNSTAAGAGFIFTVETWELYLSSYLTFGKTSNISIFPKVSNYTSNTPVVLLGRNEWPWLLFSQSEKQKWNFDFYIFYELFIKEAPFLFLLYNLEWLLPYLLHATLRGAWSFTNSEACVLQKNRDECEPVVWCSLKKSVYA